MTIKKWVGLIFDLICCVLIYWFCISAVIVGFCVVSGIEIPDFNLIKIIWGWIIK